MKFSDLSLEQILLQTLNCGIHARRLRKEIEVLRSFFDSEAGAQTLIELFIKAETSYNSEQVVWVKNNAWGFVENEFHIPDFIALANGDREELENICSFLDEHERVLAEMGMIYNSSLGKIAKEGVLAFAETKNWTDLFAFFYFTRTLGFYPPDNSDAIIVHTHPSMRYFLGYRTGIERSVGYSVGDILTSTNQTLGLVEYDAKITKKNGEYCLDVKFNIKHRIGFFEARVGSYSLSTFRDRFVFIGSRAFVGSKKKVSRIDVLRLSYCSPHTFPLFTYDKTDNIRNELRKEPGEKGDMFEKKVAFYSNLENELERKLEQAVG